MVSLISLPKILKKMARTSLTWFLSSGFPNKSNAYFVFSSLLSSFFCMFIFNKQANQFRESLSLFCISRSRPNVLSASGWRMSRRRGRIFSYLAAGMLGLVCHILGMSVAGNQLRSSRRPDFRAVLVLLFPCANLLFRSPFRIFWHSHPRRGLV